MSPASHQERELKFSPGHAFRLPDFTDPGRGIHADAAETLRLQAAYFDTTDLRLARSGASLRYRSDSGWTVKLHVSGDTALVRSELHVDGEPGDPPPAAIDLVHALIRREPLALAARLHTLRHRIVLRDGSGAQLAELVDDEVSVLDGARLAARFREFADVAFAFAQVIEDLQARRFRQRLEICRDLLQCPGAVAFTAGQAG